MNGICETSSLVGTRLVVVAGGAICESMSRGILVHDELFDLGFAPRTLGSRRVLGSGGEAVPGEAAAIIFVTKLRLEFSSPRNSYCALFLDASRNCSLHKRKVNQKVQQKVGWVS